MNNGLLKRGNQIVIPQTLRSEMLERIHHGHQGVTKCRERYRDAIWWPKISQAVTDKVLSCSHCNKHKPSQHSEPLITTPLPELPWQKLAADFKGKNFLVVMDYYSRWLETEPYKDHKRSSHEQVHEYFHTVWTSGRTDY